MKKSKRIISFAVSFIILICTLSIPAYAEEKSTALTVSTVTGVPFDKITVNINMDVNPGIMAMTFAVAYDSTVLTCIKNEKNECDYNKGLFNDYTVVDHPELGYVSFVNCEQSNKKYVGLIFSINFEIKGTAKPGFYPITIKNIRPEVYGDSLIGCFADWRGNTITATVTNGGVTVGKNPCDTNGDDEFDANDLVYMRKELFTYISGEFEQSLDVNKDGKFNLIDLVYIKKQFAKL